MTRFAVSPWFIALAALIVGVAIILWLWRRFKQPLSRNLASSKTWVSYLKGQGFLLFLFLIIGWIAAWGSTKFGPSHGIAVDHVRLIEFDSLNAAERPFREIDTDKYVRMTVFTKTVEPQNGAATVTMYADRGGSGKSEVRRLESVVDSWTRWDQPVSGQHMSFVVAPSTERNTATASHVRIMVYLSSH